MSRDNTQNISNTVTLAPVLAIRQSDGCPLLPHELEPLLHGFLDDIAEIQQELINENAHSLPERDGKFGSKWARDNVTTSKNLIPDDYIESYWTLNGCKSEAARLILAWRKRKDIWNAIQELGDKASVETVAEKLGKSYIDWKLYNNVARMSEEPAAPVIKGVQFPYCQMNQQVAQQIVFADGIAVHNIAIGADRYDIFFDSSRIYEQYPALVSVSRPTLIRKNDGGIVWHFSVIEEVDKAVIGNQTSVVAFDRNMDHKRVISGVRASMNGTLSGELGPSRQTLSAVAHAGRVSVDLSRKKKKQANAMPWDVDSPKSCRRSEDISRVGDCLDRLHDAIDQCCVDDMVGHLRPGDVLAVERLDMFGGGFVKFRHGRSDDILEHKCARLGIPLVMVNPAGTSSECPACGEKLKFLDGRRVHCDACGYDDDRDVGAAPVIAGRGLAAVVQARERVVSKRARDAGVVSRDKRRDAGRKYYEGKVRSAVREREEGAVRDARRRERKARRMESRAARGKRVYGSGVSPAPSRPVSGARCGVGSRDEQLALMRALLSERKSFAGGGVVVSFNDWVAGFYREYSFGTWATNVLRFEYGLFDTLRSFAGKLASESPDSPRELVNFRKKNNK